MVDEKPEDTPPELGRAKRAPPTIDLEASEVSGETQNPNPGTPLRRSLPWPSAAAISTGAIAAVFGAGAAALMIGAASMAGWFGEPVPPAPAPAAPQVSAATIDGLAARIASVETKANTPAAVVPDPAAAARTEALEKSVVALRAELAAARVQSEKLAASLSDVKSTPRESTAQPDLTAVNERITQIERVMRAQGAEIAQESARPVDDMPLRRIVAATLLDVLVRIGDPYPAALAAAKSLTDKADALAPLEGFAASGVPNANALCRELLTLVPKLSPPMQENSTSGTGLVDRLQAGAAKLVRIERADTAGTDRSAVVARITAAALRNDFNETRRELKTLTPADRAGAHAWLDKADARDTALAASRQFAADAMAALAKPRQ
jgi:hypothetical protein